MDGVLAEDVALGLNEVADADVSLVDGELSAEHVGKEPCSGYAKTECGCDDLKRGEQPVEDQDNGIDGGAAKESGIGDGERSKDDEVVGIGEPNRPCWLQHCLFRIIGVRCCWFCCSETRVEQGNTEAR